LGDEVKEDKIGRACSMHDKDEKCIQNFGWETLREETAWKTRYRWEDNIRMGLREIGWKGVDCPHLAQDRDQWQVL
jgi:hypothetical protein